MSTSGAASWSNYVPTGILLIAIIGGFWQLADPRSEIRDIKSAYLSLREHEEFVRRFNADLNRVEAINRDQTNHMITKDELIAHEKADDRILETFDARLKVIQSQFDLLIARSLIQPPPNVSKPN